jgi:hypothetical protein
MLNASRENWTGFFNEFVLIVSVQEAADQFLP